MKQLQRQQLQQKLSPQQIQLMRLLQLPVTDLEMAIKEEVERNPLLEATPPEEQPLPQEEIGGDEWERGDEAAEEEYDYRERSERDPNAVRREFVVSDTPSGTERLLQQLSLLKISERQQAIAVEIVGSLDDAGYLTRSLDLIANDLAFRRGIEASDAEMAEALHTVQSLDPAGVGARSLQECLTLQLERISSHRDDPILTIARTIVAHHFDNFACRRYTPILTALKIDQQQLEQAMQLIRSLNPKPAGSESESEAAAYITPDIVVEQREGKLQFYLNDGHLPSLSLNPYYTAMLHDLEQQHSDKKTLQFLRTKQGEAQSFIDLLGQRGETMRRVMRYIVQHQEQYLLTGDPDQLQPMRQREVAEATGLDISTISRMANSKYLQTDFGTIPLKECFSKGMATEDGEVAVEAIKQRLSEAVESEDKHSPLSDDALMRILNAQGMPLARRTVAKYREQLGIPTARLRRILLLVLLVIGASQSRAQMSYYDSLIAVRLEAASKSQSAPKVSPSPAAKSAVSPKPSAPKPHKAAAVHSKAEPSSTAEAAPDTGICRIWYDAFPRHRVNPLGRTQLDMMPDEINLMLVRDSSEFCFPVRNAKTSNYGWRWNRGHHGVDIRLRTGDSVQAAFGGIVRVASRMGGYGNCVVIRHPNGLETLYGHLSKINVKHGQRVAVGEVIGLGGSTGNSTGPHLHFECRFLYQTFDPEWILDFNTYSLRTRRLHLDKSFFGIRRPRTKDATAYKADESYVRESKKRRKTTATTISTKDF